MILVLSDEDEAPTAPSQLIWAIPGLLLLGSQYLLGWTRFTCDGVLRVVKVVLGDVAPALGSYLPEGVVQAAVEARRGEPCRAGLVMLPITRRALHRRRAACRRLLRLRSCCCGGLGLLLIIRQNTSVTLCLVSCFKRDH